MKKKIQKIIDKYKYDMQIGVSCGDPVEFLEKTNDYPQSIYILDILLKTDMTGLDVAKKIRYNHTYHDFLIILTTETEMMHLTFSYNIEILNFIFKDDIKMIDTSLEESLKIIHQKKDEIHREIPSVRYKGILLPYEQILYIQIAKKEKNKIEFIDLHQEKYVAKGSMKELWESGSLDRGFYYISQSTIINMQYIKRFSKIDSKVIMINESSLDVSFRNRSGLSKALKDYKKIF